MPRFPGSCTPAITSNGPACGFGQNVFEREFLPSHQSRHTLRRFAGDDAGEKLVGQQKVSTWAPICGSRRSALGGRGLVEEDGPKAQAAANGFFQNAQALDGAVAVGGELAPAEGPAQFFDQSVVASLNAAQAAASTLAVSSWP